MKSTRGNRVDILCHDLPILINPYPYTIILKTIPFPYQQAEHQL